MTTTPEYNPNSMFSNPAARGYGFTVEFWFEVCEQYMKELAKDPRKSLAVLDEERTIRWSLGDEQIDVLVRSHPDAREYQQLRFTAFPAGENGQQIPRWYCPSEERPVLGEALLVDYPYCW